MGPKTLGLIATGVVAAAACAYACVSNNDTTNIDCARYCNDMMTTCVSDDTQYQSEAICETFCSKMDMGEGGIASGDTVACRDIQVSNAKDEPDPNNKHNDCVSGGPSTTCFATPTSPDDAQCAAFCKLDFALCAGLTDYKDENDCFTTCKTWGQSFAGPLLDSTGDTLQCRTYHLELSQTGNPNDLQTHCPHTGKVSQRCFPPDGGADAGSDAAADATTD